MNSQSRDVSIRFLPGNVVGTRGIDVVVIAVIVNLCISYFVKKHFHPFIRTRPRPTNMQTEKHQKGG